MYALLLPLSMQSCRVAQVLALEDGKSLRLQPDPDLPLIALYEF